MTTFHENISWLRKTTKLSQGKFGELFSLSRGKIDSYENKDTLAPIQTANKICSYFKITLDQLFNESIEESLLKKKFAPDEEGQHVQLISELRRDKEDLRDMNKELKKKVKELEEQIVALKNKLPADPLTKRQKESQS